MPKKFPTYLCKKSCSADLEYSMYRFEKGRTYTDDGTTIMDVYTSSDDWFEPTEPNASTITVTHPEARRRR
ncbi:hypothetical protein BRAS3843_1740015 [Bradyrhizobium sp. STM 3843]|nr:hypothetical protein BRAS3843_1740015 [Bradyrhizobium sp. STM 3843]